MSDNFFADLLASFNAQLDASMKEPWGYGVRSRPSFWNPFRTWRDQEAADLLALYETGRRAFEASPFSDDKFRNKTVAEIAIRVARTLDCDLSVEVEDALLVTIAGLVDDEFFSYPYPEEPDWHKRLDLEQAADAKALLQRKRRFLARSTELYAIGCERIEAIFVRLLGSLPPTYLERQYDDDDDGPLSFRVDLIEVIRDPGKAIELAFLGAFGIEADDYVFFADLREQLKHNLAIASGFDPDDRTLCAEQMTMPSKARGMTPAEVVEAYLVHTHFATFFSWSVPFTIPDAVRFEHMHILAGTGHGKTQTLQHLILADLLRPADEVPAMVVLDSQGDMLDVLKRIRLFDPTIEGNAYAERLLIVDPSDVHFTPALNLFDIQSDRLANYDLRDREQVLAGIIEIYDYIFGGLLGAELTQKQSMVFRFLAQLMLAIPGSTIHTLRELLEDASPYTEAIASLPDTARGFFENHFFGKGYQPTREQILRRLYGVLQNPSFERMFAHPRNRLDLFDVLNRGGIVLVNTAKDFLKSEASSIFGRFIIALTLKAAMERATLHPSQRRPTFLWIDEASEYFDDTIDNLLIQARKFNLGLVMAHQYLGQLPRGLPASIMTNTSIKLAGGISDRDARVLAPEMRTTSDFLSSMTKDAGRTNFAAYVRNVTPQALRLTVPFGTAEGLDPMPPEHLALLIARSRLKLAEPPLLAAPTAPASVADEGADETEYEATAENDADELEHEGNAEDGALQQSAGEDSRHADAATNLLRAASEADAADRIVADDVAGPPTAGRLDSAPAVAGPDDASQPPSSSDAANSPTSSRQRNDKPRPPSAPKPPSNDDDPWESF